MIKLKSISFKKSTVQTSPRHNALERELTEVWQVIVADLADSTRSPEEIRERSMRNVEGYVLALLKTREQEVVKNSMLDNAIRYAEACGKHIEPDQVIHHYRTALACRQPVYATAYNPMGSGQYVVVSRRGVVSFAHVEKEATTWTNEYYFHQYRQTLKSKDAIRLMKTAEIHPAQAHSNPQVPRPVKKPKIFAHDRTLDVFVSNQDYQLISAWLSPLDNRSTSGIGQTLSYLGDHLFQGSSLVAEIQEDMTVKVLTPPLPTAVSLTLKVMATRSHGTATTREQGEALRTMY